MNVTKDVKILGLDFFNGETKDVVESLKSSGGLLVVPAAPALVKIKEDPAYYESLLNADIIIPDSGYMALLWNLRKKEKINRISGLEFIKEFVENEEVKKDGAIFLVNPTPKDARLNSEYLTKQGFHIPENMSYLAPFYKKEDVNDPALLSILESLKPKYVLINIGGGTQEKLGSYLKTNLSYRPAIICTGAAIAFLTGQQASIPGWADKLYLGWLFRCVAKPSLYIPRYWDAFKLAKIMMNEKKYLPQ